MRKPGFETPRRPDFYSTIGTKSVLETSSEKNQNFSPRCQKHVQNGVPKSTQNLYKPEHTKNGKHNWGLNLDVLFKEQVFGVSAVAKTNFSQKLEFC